MAEVHTELPIPLEIPLATLTTPLATKPRRPALTVKDFKGKVDPDWCPGCGDFGVLNALKETGKEGKIVAIGYDSGQQQIDAIKSGVMAGAITQNPVGIGAKCVDAALDAIAGKTIPKNIDTGYFWYDKTNIDKPEIAAVLYK